MVKDALPLKKKTQLIPFFAVALTIGLVSAILLFNLQERQKETNFEVTFLTPSQAVVFWTTPTPSLGYVRYGSTKNNRPLRAEQTSSEPGLVHAVVINDVPSDGLFLTVHNSTDNRFYWPKPIQIDFDPTTIE